MEKNIFKKDRVYVCVCVCVYAITESLFCTAVINTTL